MWDEANLVIERQNGRMTTEALLVQGAAGSIMSKKAGGAFQKLLKTLNVTTEPILSLFKGVDGQ